MGCENGRVSFSIAFVFVIISEATIKGKSDGISIVEQSFSATFTAEAAIEEFFIKSANMNKEATIEKASPKPSLKIRFVFFVILQCHPTEIILNYI